MQPLSDSAGQPADHSPERSVPQSDQYCSVDASKLKAFPVDSSAVQPAHHPSDADGETITGDGSHKGDERQKEATSSYSNATGESAVSQEAAYSYNYWRHPTVGNITGGVCLECSWEITTGPWDVWWTTLLVPESAMSRRPMCSPECLVEYCSAIYCPHAAMENGLQDRMWAQLSKAWKRSTNLSAMPREVLLPIVKFVGAHNLETIWTCSECKPYWYNWYCSVCRMSNRFLHWSPSSHYGHCGASCDCCRSAKKQIFPCEFCENLRNLKATCPTMQDLVKSYEGT